MSRCILKSIIIFIVFVTLVPLNTTLVSAQSIEEIIEQNKHENLDSEIIDKLDQAGIDDITLEGIRDIDFNKIFEVIINSIIDTVKKPIVILPSLIAAALFLNIYEITCFDYIKRSTVISSVFKTSVYGAITVGVSLKAMYKAVTSLKICNTFSAGLIPVYFTMLILSSKPTQSAAFQSSMLIFCNIFSSVITYIIVPAVSMCCATAYAIGITESPLLKRLNSALTSVLKYGISIFMSVFAAIITLKTNIAESVDTVTGRLTKGAISSVIPIIGRYIADSLTTLKASVSVLKSGLGIYAVVAVILIILPSLIELTILSFVFKITDSFSADSGINDCSFLKILSRNLDMLVIAQISAIIMFTYSFVIVMSGI